MTKKGQVTKNAMDSLMLSLNSGAVKEVNADTGNAEYINQLEQEIDALRQQVSGAIVKQDNVYQFRRFQMTKTKLIVPDELTEQEADEFGVMLSGMDSSLQFWMGDWANLYVADEDDDFKRGGIYDELAQRFGIENRTIREYASVCRILDPSVRTDTLLFTHHKLIAYLPKALKGREIEFLVWADKQAQTGKLTKTVLQEHIASERAKLLPTKTPLPTFEQFDKQFDKFETSQLAIVKDMSVDEREAAANRLIDLAERIKTGRV